MHVQRRTHSDILRDRARGGNTAKMDLYPTVHSFVLSMNTVGQSSSFSVTWFNQLLSVSCTTLEKSLPLCVRNSVEMGKQTSHPHRDTERETGHFPTPLIFDVSFLSQQCFPQVLGLGFLLSPGQKLQWGKKLHLEAELGPPLRIHPWCPYTFCLKSRTYLNSFTESTSSCLLPFSDCWPVSAGLLRGA